MKYDVTHSCGHTETISLFGPEDQRRRTIAALEHNGMCSACKAAANIAVSEQNKEAGMVALEGSQRQIIKSKCDLKKTGEQKMNKAQEEKTVTIYKVTCTKGYQITDPGTGFSLAPWGRNTDYFEGFDDGGKEYVLLDGYHVAESNSGSLEIYDPANQRCAITNSFGKPCIVSNRGAITLKKKN